MLRFYVTKYIHVVDFFSALNERYVLTKNEQNTNRIYRICSKLTKLGQFKRNIYRIRLFVIDFRDNHIIGLQ